MKMKDVLPSEILEPICSTTRYHIPGEINFFTHSPQNLTPKHPSTRLRCGNVQHYITVLTENAVRI